MKKLEFKTSKGEFLLICVDTLTDEYRQQALINGFNNFRGLCIDDELFELIYEVKHITEEHFAEVVDESFDCWMSLGYKDYENENAVYVFAKESFESLIKSLGWYLFENPECPNQFCDNGYIDLGYNEKARCSLCEETEERVFENPILLKKI